MLPPLLQLNDGSRSGKEHPNQSPKLKIVCNNKSYELVCAPASAPVAPETPEMPKTPSMRTGNVELQFAPLGFYDGFCKNMCYVLCPCWETGTEVKFASDTYQNKIRNKNITTST